MSTAVKPVQKTTGYSRPFAVCTVISVTTPAPPSPSSPPSGEGTESASATSDTRSRNAGSDPGGARIGTATDFFAGCAFDSGAEDLAGELGRLLGSGAKEVSARRLASATEAAEQNGCCVLLKGSDTLVVGGERATVNSTGSPQRGKLTN